MADIKKKNTSKLNHIQSRHIVAAQIDDRDENNIRYVVAFENNEIEKYLPVTRAVYDLVRTGNGLTHPRLRTGLTHCSKFRFNLVTDKLKKRGSDKEVETITAIHIIPDHPYNLCDWESELGRRVDKDVAIIDIRPDTGGISVHAFPNNMVGVMDRFVRAVEGLTKIDGQTSFKVGDVTYQVMSIYANEVTFRCTAPRKIR